ncbi:hypothetical protein N8I74_03110 [Chitiniphilus purpureus]|uniref:Uncharacterized protein n=1 Tax=Chitiniphilus purpureus TaxID=2981137 RepID=A0ABY6DNS3_9NEIS|nr:hypothetical protein [Chitiniphilus sp. CD1]UXY16025.1 hypothetical protein N8I74_03110 [Chitiniphilus sp. CD1]
MPIFNFQLVDAVQAYTGPPSSPFSPRLQADTPASSPEQPGAVEAPWDGVERRNGQDRRQQRRRQAQQAMPLDTRTSQDRRLNGRRATDVPVSISLKV